MMETRSSLRYISHVLDLTQKMHIPILALLLMMEMVLTKIIYIYIIISSYILAKNILYSDYLGILKYGIFTRKFNLPTISIVVYFYSHYNYTVNVTCIIWDTIVIWKFIQHTHTCNMFLIYMIQYFNKQ